MARIAENTVIVDGQEYKPGDVIPDFKSIKCVDTREPRKYQGLSADVSVLNDVIAKYASGGASCFMSDTGEYYEYDRKEKTWKLITNITERGFDSEKAYGALKHMLKNVTVSDEKIQSAVTDYLTVNPVLPGATTEQAQQIEQNKTDVASLKEETGSLKEDLVKLNEEVFYSTDTIKIKYKDVGFCISIDGKKQVKDGYIIGKYPVVENEVLFVSLSKDNSNGAVYQFMNNTAISYENNNYRVGNTVTEAYNGFITVPEGATYLFVSSLQSNTTNVVKKTKSEIDTLKEEVSNSAKDVYDIQSFLYPCISELNHNGGYLKYNDGEIAPTSYGKYTDYISLKSYTNVKYTCGIGNSTVAFVCFYDADYGYLKNISVQASSVKSGDIDITKEEYSNARYVRFSYYDNRDIADYSLFVGLLYSKESLDEKLKTIAPIYKIHNKNVLIFGDSITDCCPQANNSDYQTTSYYFREPSNYYTNAEGQTVNYDMWPKLFKDICEPKEVRNYAKSGATYKNQDGTRLSLSNQIRIALNDLNNPNGVFSQNTFVPDVVIFALGTNDGANPNDTYESAMNKTVLKADGYTVDVEATLSNLDLSKFNEAVRYAFLTIKNRFPMAQVFVSLPIQRNSWEMYESNLVKSLEKMAKRYGCIVIDATAESGIISDINIYNNLGILLKDGLHPNEYGSNLLARMFITSVESHYMPMDAMNN